MAPAGNAQLLAEYLQSEYRRQMESWLDYVWEHHKEPRFARRQTARFVGTRNKYKRWNWDVVGDNKAKSHSYNSSKGGKKSARAAFNNKLLYDEWVKVFREEGFPEERSQKGRRVCVQYIEAVPEMHIFLDWMNDNFTGEDEKLEEESLIDYGVTWDELLGEEE